MTTQLAKLSPVLLLSALFLCTADNAMAQTAQCTLKLSELPQSAELMGFRLGMTMDQVKKRVPQVVFGKTDALGTAKTTINPDFDPSIDKASFDGVRSVSLDFLDSQLTSLWIGFDGSFKWSTVEEFVRGITTALRLPNNWQPWKNRGQQLSCADFTITVSMIADGPSFHILDQKSADLLADRRQAEADQDSSQPTETERTEDIIANTVDKTYYPTGCHPAKPLELKDQVVFKSADAAEKAGYKRSKSCL